MPLCAAARSISHLPLRPQRRETTAAKTQQQIFRCGPVQKINTYIFAVARCAGCPSRLRPLELLLACGVVPADVDRRRVDRAVVHRTKPDQPLCKVLRIIRIIHRGSRRCGRRRTKIKFTTNYAMQNDSKGLTLGKLRCSAMVSDAGPSRGTAMCSTQGPRRAAGGTSRAVRVSSSLDPCVGSALGVGCASAATAGAAAGAAAAWQSVMPGLLAVLRRSGQYDGGKVTNAGAERPTRQG